MPVSQSGRRRWGDWMGGKKGRREGRGEEKGKIVRERQKGKLKNRSQKSSSNEQQSEYKKTDLNEEGREGCCCGGSGGHRHEMRPSDACFSLGLAERDESGRHSKTLASPVAAHCLRLQCHIRPRVGRRAAMLAMPPTAVHH